MSTLKKPMSLDIRGCHTPDKGRVLTLPAFRRLIGWGEHPREVVMTAQDLDALTMLLAKPVVYQGGGYYRVDLGLQVRVGKPLGET